MRFGVMKLPPQFGIDALAHRSPDWDGVKRAARVRLGAMNLPVLGPRDDLIARIVSSTLKIQA